MSLRLDSKWVIMGRLFARISVVICLASTVQGQDWDDDGLPDYWEFDAFGGLEQDGASDEDGDGHSNFDEYLIGSAPLDFNSSLKIVSADIDHSGWSLEYARRGGRDVLLEASNDLREWRPLAPATSEESESLIRAYFDPLVDESLFVRLQVAAPNPTAQVEEPEFKPTSYETFDDWRRAIESLPYNGSQSGSVPSSDLLPLKSPAVFDEAFDAVLRQFQRGSLGDPEHWVGTQPNPGDFLNPHRAYFLRPQIAFQPFAQKLEVPVGAEAVFHGDFHGDVKSLVAQIDWLNNRGYMEGFKIVRPNFYFVFLGDYTDRGVYGLEVIYTLLRLKVQNPEHVFMARGNHEDWALNNTGGFLSEVISKFGKGYNIPKLFRFYDFLPTVIYFGTEGNYIQCCHGGMEPGFLPNQLLASAKPVAYELLGRLDRKVFLDANPLLIANVDEGSRSSVESSLIDYTPTSPATPSGIGFMWNDFYLTDDEPGLGFTYGRGFVYGKRPVQVILNASSTPAARVRGVFRGHQHSAISNPMMRRLIASRGVHRHWQQNDKLVHFPLSSEDLKVHIETEPERPMVDGGVWTFNVAPDSIYGKFLNYNWDSFGILKTAKDYGDWRLSVVNTEIVPAP